MYTVKLQWISLNLGETEITLFWILQLKWGQTVIATKTAVNYFGCILDYQLPGEAMALKQIVSNISCQAKQPCSIVQHHKLLLELQFKDSSNSVLAGRSMESASEWNRITQQHFVLNFQCTTSQVRLQVRLPCVYSTALNAMSASCHCKG